MITLGIQADVAIGDIEKYNLVQRFSFASYGINFYIFNFLFPFDPVTYYPYPKATAIPLLMKVAPILAVLGLGTFFYFLRRNRLMVFGALFFLVNIALTLQFVQVGSSIVSDRYTYLSYLGIFFILAGGSHFMVSKPSNKKYRMILFGIFGLYLIYFCLKSNSQCQTWNNSGTLWTNVLEWFPNSYAAFTSRGNYYAEEQELENAFSDIDKAFVIAPKNYNVLISRSTLLRKRNLLEEALTSANGAIEIKPEESEAYLNRGNVYFALQNYIEAESDFKMAISLSPSFSDSYSNLGSVYFRRKNYSDAVTMYNKALSLNPLMRDALLNKSASLLYLESYEEAIQTLEKLTSLERDIPNAFYFLGLAYSKSNRMQPALENYNEAIRLDPENNNYYRARADVFRALGDSEKMKADLDRLKN